MSYFAMTLPKNGHNHTHYSTVFCENLSIYPGYNAFSCGFSDRIKAIFSSNVSISFLSYRDTRDTIVSWRCYDELV